MHGRVVVAALLVFPSAAFGETGDATIGFSVAYDAPADCPSRSELEQAIVSRAADASVVAPEAATLRFEVALVPGSPETRAVLVTTLPDGTHSRRDVTADSCSEAISALAVIAALSVSGYRESKAAAPASPESDTAPNALAPEPAPSVEKPGDPETAVPSPVLRVDEAATPATPSRTKPLRPGAFADATWESAVAPSAPFGVSAGVELAWARSGVWWPNLRAGVVATLAGSVTRDEGSATFRLTAARVGFCPVGWGDVRGRALRACAELDAGALRASGSGSDLVDPRDQTMPWFGAGLSGRGEWPLVTWLSLEAAAGVRALARHDEFVFRPETVVYDVPPFSVGLALGVVGRLP